MEVKTAQVKNRFFSVVLKAGLLCFLLAAVPIHGDISLEGLLKENELDLYWDDILNRGMIWRGDEVLTFMPEVPLMTHNFLNTSVISPPYFQDGTLYFPDSTADRIQALFVRPESADTREISTIFIDPGHGGKDPGTIGTLASGEPIYEKHIVMEVARDLARRLGDRYPGKEIVISREDDRYLTLEQRTALANGLSSGPDEKIVFISIHANAALNSRAKGIEVWYLPPEYRRQLLEPDDVDSENSSVLPILNSILEEEYTVESIILAQNIERGMMAELGGYTRSRGLKEMDWYVVRKAHMPSVLVEVGFVTNPEEVELLNNPLYLQNISKGIYNGITDFIQDFESVSQ
ncbi:N-acetylmuramoyl-L-alanine amidase [Salinispira pacifica]|uniref:N-acetylmuramoyl-L-alanine amidase n=1 Tax=Salinispira pacifica TaxID=1307761 RepID=V5WHJ1_9SPIO|nr:N-acetylmuramoyl-L-alanine amidase [Salinispira pacifica]